MGKSYGFIEIPSTTAAIDALDIIANPHEEIVKIVERSASRLK